MNLSPQIILYDMCLDVADDIAEHVSDGRSEEGQNDNYNNSNQNKNQRVLYEALSSLFRSKQHNLSPPFGYKFARYL